MDLHSGYPFWAVKNGLLNLYPRLQNDLTCEVVVIGGGISGALIAHYLSEANIDTVVLEKREMRCIEAPNQPWFRISPKC